MVLRTTQLPFLPPRKGGGVEGPFRSGDPSLALLPLHALWGQGKRHWGPTELSHPGLAYTPLRTSLQITFSLVSLWPQPWVVLSQLLSAGLHGAGVEEIRICLVSIFKGSGPQPQQPSFRKGSEVRPWPPNLRVLVCKKLFIPPLNSLIPQTFPNLSARRGACPPAGRALIWESGDVNSLPETPPALALRPPFSSATSFKSALGARLSALCAFSHFILPTSQ